MEFSSNISGSLSACLRFWKYKLKICMRAAEVVCVVVMITYTERVKYISHNSYDWVGKIHEWMFESVLTEQKQTPHARMPAHA